MIFEIGDKVVFGQRQESNRTTRNKTIPRYKGVITRINQDRGSQTIVWVQAPDLQHFDIPFTQRKNGNWVRMKDHDDPHRLGSRVALRLTDEFDE
jgi:hypothetical protein